MVLNDMQMAQRVRSGLLATIVKISGFVSWKV